MALQSKSEIAVAWRALSDTGQESGWRCIPISTAGTVGALAGRHFPDNAEAILVGFRRLSKANGAAFPKGNGFRVERAELEADGKTWIALIREASASLDMFTLMAEDVSSVLASRGAADDGALFQAFLGRIRAWQSFMKNGDLALGPEAELGLAGELTCLKELLTNGVPAQIALDAWVGPLDGLQDFELGSGAIEVKSTLAISGFPAKILSLEQLDDSVRQPLFVCACRFRLGEDGMTLPMLVKTLEDALAEAGASVADLRVALLHAGYLDSQADRYVRKLANVSCEFRLVSDGFPRLTPGTVPLGVRAARYDIDLDQVTGGTTPTTQMLTTLMGW
ncbi:PD-(D/E)XK motif protein [Cupriavidus gilardii]|uniref:PD-(D/E)XK motif protein n=1 Tax=Cupriavidus gilardii TaxID=82541 RepID=A0ABY4VT54_9BURK|nr:PD-(D/E)XK motif protein [Cupriavidus gilardii]USE80461.1 PD-(D/E)XK motif protein [Cupriavidus gilardii]UXC36331.1 PD-(D/E)XK motif protein [Cupriavidus gilardii]